MSARARRNGEGFSLERMVAVLVKEFIQLTRDRITYALILAVPVIQMLLFGYAINTDPRHLPTAVFVQENSVFARSVLSGIANSSYFRITHQARSPAELDQLVRTGEVQFAITIPGDFTRRVVRGERIGQLAADGHWQGLAKQAMRDDLAALQRTLAGQILAGGSPREAPEALLEAWMQSKGARLARARALLAELRAVPAPDPAMLSVALRELRHLA